jgi:2-haloacid dehalogenase
VIRAVAFDLGGVLLDWDPRHLFRRLLPDETSVESFLEEVDFFAWNGRLDRGVPIREGVAELCAAHPRRAWLIEAFAANWLETVAGPIAGMPSLVGELRRRGMPCFVCTNSAAETFGVARAAYPFLGQLDGAVVSGELGCCKPDGAFYAAVLDRVGLPAPEILFVDDRTENVAGAERAGLTAVHFTDVEALRVQLARCGVTT